MKRGNRGRHKKGLKPIKINEGRVHAKTHGEGGWRVSSNGYNEATGGPAEPGIIKVKKPRF